MTTFEIYNVNLGESLGSYTADTEDQALDAMARDYGFADYADAIREYGILIEEAKAELQITVL